eukprot:TRINITY_DN2874_c0_g1_i1.p1 TRINITY_DN2874_c0_g1~~TRINITY_DN2874_c0_g1_i1.p1  ORF type:complete len:445 (-),score=73.58 TRINITY_DN2874_c0_g1_i1:94-1428(-)
MLTEVCTALPACNLCAPSWDSLPTCSTKALGSLHVLGFRQQVLPGSISSVRKATLCKQILPFFSDRFGTRLVSRRGPMTGNSPGNTLMSGLPMAESVGAVTDGAGVDLDRRKRPDLEQAIKDSLSNCLTVTKLDETVPALKNKIQGKVRDIYDAGEYLLLVTSDRQSAFDRLLASVPFKGQVLNLTSVWWFNNTRHIVPNAFISSPDPNVTIAKKCTVFPVEFVVRGYVTGSTSTSLWTVYNKGVRSYCGNDLPEGMVKNERLEGNILTPTTKAAEHDLPVTPQEIIEQGLMTEDDLNYVRSKALALFAYGQEVAMQHGLVLVDTKYEFGRAADGTIMLIDEVHTPDSSRYWVAATYEERHAAGLEPENIDKEFLRLWFKSNCDPYNDKVLPDAPPELVTELSWRYILLYETITGVKFSLSEIEEPIHERISRNVRAALERLQT